VDYRYPDAPRRVYWELTRACALACRHCRAEALHERLPDELDTAAAFGVLASLARATPAPVVVLTGGDPLERPDFWQILEHARGLGLHVDVAPSATPKLDRDVIFRLAEHGVGALSLSLDGSTPERHDAIRGIPGCYDVTMVAARHVADAGIPLQVNTLVTADTLADLPAVCGRAGEMHARRWSLFFLVTTGRGSLLPQITAQQADALLEWLAERNDSTPFVIATTEAPQYRRVLLRRRGIEGDGPVPGAGMRDGNGILFISYRGDVMPSGFLPLCAGNVRDADVLDLYSTAPLFVRLREPASFGGRCGRCEFRRVCGGSRGRAFAASGDPMAEDPLCGWQPAAAPA
jgi:AdoMet-dependent heme synthase